MSRSYKKKKVLKDKSRSHQKLGNRIIRRRNKSKLRNVDEDTMFEEDKSEVVNDYNVTDWKFFIDDDDTYSLKGKDKRLYK